MWRYPGFRDDAIACMAGAALFVLSSAWEGLPTVLIEALAAGTRVVSTDCPAAPGRSCRTAGSAPWCPWATVAPWPGP